MPVRFVFLIFLGGAFAGCSWAPPASHAPSSQTIVAPGASPQVSNPSGRDVNPVLVTARKMLGIKYAYGGHAPDTGFDCSGLVYYSHAVHGISVPRTAAAQYRFAQPVPRNSVRPGDLMFFKTSGRRISHVGIYLGPGRFLHAPGTGKKVTVADYRSTYWRARYAGAGRINAALRTSAVQNPR